MIHSQVSRTGKLVCVGVGVLFLGSAQPSFAQQAAKRPDAQQQSQPERRQREAESFRGDRERWDITDEAIEAWVTIKLAARPGLNDVRVEVQDGVARVSGTVGSEAAESRAMRIAGSTFGVRSVRDQVSIDKSLLNRQVERVPDRDLAQRVARAIASKIEGARAGEDWWFTGWRVEGMYNRWSLVVEADDGRVNLEGEVPDIETMRKAVEAARSVDSVRAVDSDLNLERHYYRGYADPGAYAYPYHPYAYGYRHHPYAMMPDAWERREQDARSARGR